MGRAAECVELHRINAEEYGEMGESATVAGTPGQSLRFDTHVARRAVQILGMFSDLPRGESQRRISPEEHDAFFATPTRKCPTPTELGRSKDVEYDPRFLSFNRPSSSSER